jgi:hypothetical protein
MPVLLKMSRWLVGPGSTGNATEFATIGLPAAICLAIAFPEWRNTVVWWISRAGTAAPR